jgi:hypothetical protein
VVFSSFLLVATPISAYADYEKITKTSHEFFDVDTAVRQKSTTSKLISEGYLEFVFKFSNIRPRFNPNIVDEEGSCIGVPRAQWDTYYNLNHNITLTSSDYVGSESGPSRSGRWIRILINIKLSQNGTPLFNSSNPNYEVAFDEQNTMTQISQEMKIRDKFTLEGQQLISKPFVFPVYAGEEFVVEQETQASQNFDCPRQNFSGGHEFGDDIEVTSSLVVEKKSQELSLQVPLQMNLSNKVERISFSSSSKLAVTAIEKTPSMCIVDRDLVYIKSVGLCLIEFSQGGDSSFLPAKTILKEVRIIASPTPKPALKIPSIKCVKGKSSLVVSGKNPKCPVGYKKK